MANRPAASASCRSWSPQALAGVAPGHHPNTAESEERVRHLRQHGPTPPVFTLRDHYPPPEGGIDAGAASGPHDWLWPA